MAILPDIFSHRIDHGNGSHADVLLNQGSEGDPDQYAALSWNPIMHPRGGAGNPGEFTKKIGVDQDAMSSPEPGGPGMESDEPQAMVAPPLPPARSAVARVDLPDEINNKVQELAAHIPDYLLDGEGRTEDAHITLKILSDDDPSQIASLLQDEAPFRAVLGQVTVVDATEARPFDVVAIKVHSPAINRLHQKLSRALDDVGTRNGFTPHLRVADVQPGTADKWIGWDGLEGESVIVDSLTFVNRNHEAHKIPLQGQKGEYQLDRPKQYAAKQMSIFDAPVQSQQRAAAQPIRTSTPLLDPSAAQSTAVPSPSKPLYRPPPADPAGPLFAKQPAATIRPPRPVTMAPSLGPPPPSTTDYTPDEMSQIQREVEALANEISEARRNWTPPQESFVDDENEPESQEMSDEFDDRDRPVRDESEFGSEPNAGGESRGMESGRTSSFSDRRTGGPRGIKTARAEFMPQGIDTSIVPASIRGLLRPMQVEDSAMAIQAMTKHGGFLNASGTGSGKSWSTMATAKYWTDNNHKVLIVTPNEAINPDYETGQYTGAFRSAGKAMSVNPILNGGTKPMKPGEIHITTYHRFHELESQVDENTIIMWDESHLLKNQSSNRSQTGDRMNQKAKAVLYATATPADKPVHIAHLFRAKVFGNRSPEKTYRELGLAPFDEKNDDGTVRQSWRIDPDIGPIEVYRRLNGLFNQMTKEGLMVKRDLDMTGMTIYLKHLDLPQKANDVLTHIEMEASNGMGVHSLQGLAKGRLLMDLRRQQEPFKVPYLTELIKHELKDTGRQVVVYTGRVNPSSVTRGGEQIFSSSGTPKLIKQQLETHFPAKIGELHGGSDNPPAVSMRNFQDGHTNTLIATMERGGIGIDLDDQHGDKPRTMIILTAPFAGDRNAQMLGRIWRDSTRTPHGHTNAIYLFANTDIDHWNRDLIAGKMRTLGAVVQGAARDLEIPFDVGEEGLMDLAKQNQSERERHRDMVARGLLKQPYEWRQLSGLPPEEQPVVQPQLAAEGIEALKPGQAGYKQKAASQGRGRGLSQIGHKKTVASTPGQAALFTQDGTPERYTMTAAEIAEAVKSWKEPSKAQIEAENYRKPRIHIHGIEIAIENPRGTSRKTGWKPLSHHYGHLARAVGASAPESHDGEKLDCFIGSKPTSEIIFIVDQEHESGRFDEHKILFAFDNMADAKKGYLTNYPSDFRCGRITAMTVDQFKAWLEDGNFQERVAEQVSRYGAKYAFEDLHPRHEQNKRFVEKHASLTLAQTIDRPPTPGERKTYDDYVDFLKVGKNKPLSFKDWLKFHRTTKFYQAQKERENAAKTSPGGRDSKGPEQDPEADTGPDQGMEAGERARPRDPGAVGAGGEAEQLIGGKADKRPERTFDPEALAKGIKVEMEHTDDPAIASEVARDHLSERSTYYDDLAQMEAGNADSDESEAVDQDQDEDEDSEQERTSDETEGEPSRPSRSTGRPSKHSLNAIRDFAVSLYTVYYQGAE